MIPISEYLPTHLGADLFGVKIGKSSGIRADMDYLPRVSIRLMGSVAGAALLVLIACGKSEKPVPSSGSGPKPEQVADAPPEQEPKPPAESPVAQDPTESAPKHSAEAIAAADAKYKQVCATCHGQTGKGDSPAAANFPVKPRDYSDAEWQASVTDEYLSQVILEGGAAVGKSALMPASPDLKDKPEVLSALVAKVRSFAE